MIERTTSVAIVLAYCMWGAAVSFFGVAAIVMGFGAWKPALLIAEGACIVSAFAATMHIRCFAIRGCNLLRNMGREGVSVPLQRVP